MAAIVLGYNPRYWNRWDYPAVVRAVGRHPRKDRWNVARHRHIPVGADAYLLLQGERRGLIGHGVVTGPPYPAPHFLDPDRTTNYVELSWDALVPLEDRLDPEELALAVPGFPRVRSSGTPVPDPAEPALAALWRTHLAQVDICPGSCPNRPG